MGLPGPSSEALPEAAPEAFPKALSKALPKAFPKAAVVLAGAIAVGAAAAWLWHRREAGTYLRFDTMFGKARVYEVADDDGCPVRLLEVGGIVQSGTYLDDRYTELVFEYLKRYDVMFDLGRPIARVLVMGCGGYDYPEHLVANHPGVQVDAVEIDPAITAIAQRYFFLDRLVEEYETERTGRLKLICADAREYLEAAEGLYDAVVNDTFDAGEPAPQLVTREAMQAVKARLVPGGAYLTNIVAGLEGPRSIFLRDQVGKLETVFAHVGVIPCATDGFADEDNVIVVASDAPLPKLPGFHPDW